VAKDSKLPYLLEMCLAAVDCLLVAKDATVVTLMGHGNISKVME
jgi:hypothetical protein